MSPFTVNDDEGGRGLGPGRGTPRIVSVAALSRGTGRTSTVVNVAALLALAGRRVLVVGLDPEKPNLGSYLARLRTATVDSTETANQVLGRDLTTYVAGDDPWPGRSWPQAEAQAWRCGLPQTTVTFDLLETSVIGVQRDRTASLRRALLRAPVDFVLVDHSRLDFDTTLRDVTSLCDVAVVAYRQDVAGEEHQGQELLRAIGASSPAPELIALATFAPADTPLDEIRVRVGRNCRAVLVPPAKPELRDHDGAHLSVLVDDPAEEGTELAGYRRLAEHLSAGSVESKPVFSERVRNRYRRVIGLENSVGETAALLYEPADRPSVDWLRRQLELADFQVIAREPAAAAAPELVISVIGRSGAEPVVDPPGDVEHVRVRFTPRDDTAPADPPDVLDLSQGDEATVRGRLLQQGLIVGADAGPDAPRFPRRRPPTSNLLRPVPWFVGRGPELEQLRDELLAGPAPVVVRGEPGHGKSELVREYGRRFGYDYDITWWINAENRTEIRRSLGALADRLSVPHQGDAAQAVLAALAGRSWLLVFDHADRPEVIQGFVPSSSRGRVIVTTRSGGDGSFGPSSGGVHVGELSPADSLALITGALKGIPSDTADDLIAEVGRAPINLQLALSRVRQSAWGGQRRKAEPEAESVRSAVVDLISTLRSGGDTGGPITVLDAAIEEIELRELGVSTVRLAEMCSFLAADHISLDLLSSRGMIARLVTASGEFGGRLAADGAELHRIIRLGLRFGLFQLDWRRERLRMHRIVQDALRARMSAADRETRRTEMLRALADFVPSEAGLDASGRQADLATIAGHIGPTQAVDSPLPEVRRWLILHVRREFLEGDRPRLDAAMELATALVSRWVESDPVNRVLQARLKIQLANIERARGAGLAALGHDDDARRILRGIEGLDHPRTLAASRGIGGDLRTLGRFDEGLDEDEATHLGFRRIYGDEHPETMMAAHNLGISMYLNGDPAGALALATIVAGRWAELFDSSHPNSIGARLAVAQYQRELGELDRSQRTLVELTHALPEQANPALRLNLERQTAILDRLAGYTVVRDGERIRDTCRLLFGDQHPLTLVAQMSFALDHFAAADLNRAVRSGREAVLGYEAALGFDAAVHPFISVCRSNLAVFLRSAGQHREALDLGEAAYRELSRSLQEVHPWTVAAAGNYAGHLLADGRRDQARTLLTEAYEQFRDHHPGTGDDLDPAGEPGSHPYLARVAATLRVLNDRPLDGPEPGGLLGRTADFVIDLPET